MTRTKLILLGTGTPSLDPGLAQSASVLIVDDTPYVVDCGSGTLQRLAQARVKEPIALAHEKLTTLFITHLHPDHTLGLADFIISEWVKRRRDPLKIYGPTGIAKMAHGLLDLYHIGIEQHRIGGPSILDPIVLDVMEHTEGIIYRDPLVEVEAFGVDHAGLETYGLKFVTPDKTVVFSADTCAVPIMAEKATGCDILLHEAVCETGLDKVPKRWSDYMRRVHTTARELGQLAAQSQPKLLVLNHQMLYGGATPDDMLREIREGGFEGEVVYGRDLDVFE